MISLWILLQFIASQNFNMRTSVDSELYISGADDMINGQFPKGREIFYFSYMCILAVLSILNLGYENVIYVHFLAAIIAIYFSYQLALKLTDNNPMAVITPLLYILWIKFQQWNLIIYTDAIFSHMVIISIYALVKSRNVKEQMVVILLIIFTSFLRPSGLGLLIATAIYLVNRFTESREVKLYPRLIMLTLLILIFAWFLNYALNNFIDSFIESYKMAEIIYPNINILVNQPLHLYIPDTNYQPLFRLFLFIVNNPVYFIKISIVKGLLFLGHIKPYYSFAHNLFIVGFLYPTYLLAIKGFLSMKKDSLKLLMLSFLVFQFLTICLTTENWDGRFLLPILPVIFTLASIGVSNYLYKKPVVTLDSNASARS